MIRGNRKIRAPRAGRGTAADRGGDFEVAWQVLASSFSQIHTKNASHLSYEELYRHAYRVILTKKGEDLYNKFRDYEEKWLCDQVLPPISLLLNSTLLQNAESGTSINERRVAGETFMRGLREAWQDHQLCTSMLSDVLMYLDRAFCLEFRQPNVQSVEMALFRDCILRSRASQAGTVQDLLNMIILDQIKMEREGDMIERHLIKSCVYILEGLYESFTQREEERLYVSSFEQQYLDASRQYYKTEAESMLKDLDSENFCRRTSMRLEEEKDRCRSTLSETTIPKIKSVVVDELVQKNIKELVEMETGACNMIDNERFEALRLLYNLNGMIDENKVQLISAVQRRILELGSDVNKEVSTGIQTRPALSEAEAEKKAAAEKGMSPQTIAAIKWVEEVLALKDKFDTIWKRSFKSDNNTHASITKSFSEFVNDNARSSEYISLFIDENMKKGLRGKTEAEVDEVLEKAIVLIRYVSDKDIFERYYKKHLCRRLLFNKSMSIDVEKQMVSRLKVELGNSFTSKIEAMFRDMTISDELTSGYKTHVENLGAPDPERIELGATILTSMTWPLDSLTQESQEDDSGPRPKVIYPPLIERIRKGFEDYYGQKHSGRRLTWVPKLGTADIRATFPKAPTRDGSSIKERRHDINVPTYGMMILMLFNDLAPGGSLAYEEIEARTNIPTDDLMRNLQSLAVVPKTRVLVKKPMSKDVKKTDRFSFNESFQSKFWKVKVGLVAANKVEGEKERKETEKKNDDTRAFVIEAALVRIMKQRKHLSHQELTSEAISHLAHRFKPEVAMVKKRIEALIEREYLERVENSSPPSYKYLA